MWGDVRSNKVKRLTSMADRRAGDSLLKTCSTIKPRSFPDVLDEIGAYIILVRISLWHKHPQAHGNLHSFNGAFPSKCWEFLSILNILPVSKGAWEE